jgi:hypothetical protein
MGSCTHFAGLQLHRPLRRGAAVSCGPSPARQLLAAAPGHPETSAKQADFPPAARESRATAHLSACCDTHPRLPSRAPAHPSCVRPHTSFSGLCVHRHTCPACGRPPFFRPTRRFFRRLAHLRAAACCAKLYPKTVKITSHNPAVWPVRLDSKKSVPGRLCPASATRSTGFALPCRRLTHFEHKRFDVRSEH